MARRFNFPDDSTMDSYRRLDGTGVLNFGQFGIIRSFWQQFLDDIDPQR